MEQQIPKLQYKDGTPMRKVKTNYIDKFKTDSMAQQTAVEWFQEQIIKIVNGKCELSEIQIFEQAKQMEKDQIEDAHIEGQRVFDKHPHTQWTNDQAEQYYNETFKK